MASVTLLARLVGDAKSMTAAFEQGEKSAGSLDKTMQMASRGALVAGAAASGALVLAVKAGSDFNETLSKSNTIFGQNAKEIEAWAAGAAKGFGQSKTQALDAAGSFGNMFTQLGIGSDDAATMSKRMVELASDFASFHNADISQVLIAQQAAFRGEYDALQRFVPTINAALVQEKAMAMGLAKTTKELTMQDKALATNALIIEGAGAAAGDFARTQGGAANTTRQMQASLADLSSAIGTAVIPVLLKLAPLVIKFIDAVSNVPAPVLAVALGLTALLGVFVLIAPAIIAIIAMAPLMGAAFTGMLVPIGLVVAAIAALIAIGVLLWQNWDEIKAKADALGFGNLIAGIEAIGKAFMWAWEQGGKLLGRIGEIEARNAKGEQTNVKGVTGEAIINSIPILNAISQIGKFGKFMGARAGGGPVSAGMSYLVGERGPEMFVPGSSGAIRPAGNTVVNITVDGFVLGSSPELTRLVQQALNDGQRRFGGAGY